MVQAMRLPCTAAVAVRRSCAAQVNAYGFTFHDDQGENIMRTMLPLIDLANHAEAGALSADNDADA